MYSLSAVDESAGIIPFEVHDVPKADCIWAGFF